MEGDHDTGMEGGHNKGGTDLDTSYQLSQDETISRSEKLCLNIFIYTLVMTFTNHLPLLNHHQFCCRWHQENCLQINTFSQTAYHAKMNVMVKLLTKREHLSPSINPVLIMGIRDRGQVSLVSKIPQLETFCYLPVFCTVVWHIQKYCRWWVTCEWHASVIFNIFLHQNRILNQALCLCGVNISQSHWHSAKLRLLLFPLVVMDKPIVLDIQPNMAYMASLTLKQSLHNELVQVNNTVYNHSF